METVQTLRQSCFPKIHRVVGVIGILAFLGTGMYMRIAKHGLEGIEALPRMMFRSAHIYLLLASLINLALGLSLTQKQSRLQNIASILILIAPALMLVAFFVEPGLESFERPFAGPGIYALFAGMLLNLIAFIRS